MRPALSIHDFGLEFILELEVVVPGDIEVAADVGFGDLGDGDDAGFVVHILSFLFAFDQVVFVDGSGFGLVLSYRKGIFEGGSFAVSDGDVDSSLTICSHRVQ